MDNNDYERKDFNDFVAEGTPPDNSSENLAFLADVSPELDNFDFSALMFD